MHSRLRNRLGWLEAGLYLGGVALLAVFFQLRADAELQREQGVRAFEASLADKAASHSGWIPDQELWSDKRIRDYEESIQVDAEPPLALMKIARLGIEVPVYNGTDEFNLNRGAGRIKGTAWIDSPGNLGIAGHRDGFFRGLKDIEIGDEIELRTAGGAVNYRVSSFLIVEPDDVSVLGKTAETTLTLVTCYPFYYVGHAPKRFIVKAEARHPSLKF
ncbi:MAG: class D sortase [Xanthomonadales bacterium]|nr:class D sortase [Gammaproteobacteria bacterium]MBT8052668.1 class D sortase [Gammaproteobacteria bacterium]NND56573.1 class D sortase [Xanthomonadales bacterium]NNK52485.1 class D sortase [Xanthomonadales bacterium]